jgi:WD40 repeat protein
MSTLRLSQSRWRRNLQALTHRTNFIITTSVDGHIKLWKKQEQGIEFVKHYRTSLKAIVGMNASEDGKLVATISANGEGRVFDVVNFGACSDTFPADNQT